ncbi:MAG TPA: DUF4397 domain-containing protein [Mucilaginibacter sp.]|jgi:hypothetical protein|nr:DUF4397 domain-containing protein [Mucilaginibacter sp.]
MKYLKLILAAYFFSSLFSCKKEAYSNNGSPTSSLTIVNAIVGSSPLIADYYGDKNVSTYYSTAPSIPFGSSNEYGITSGSVPFVIYQQSDTTNAVYRNSITLAGQGIYSLFLSGSTTTPESIITTDHPPYHPAADSTVGVRFINLSPGSSPVSVNIQGKANGSEVQTLAYKSITSFKNYPATYNVSQYIFEFRDAGSGNLLSSFTISGINYGDDGDTNTNNYRWKNITIVLDGLPGSQGAFQVNNY